MLTHTRPTLWLPTMEVQENPQTGTLSHMNMVLMPQVITIIRTWDNFKNVEYENHTTLKALTRDLDDLQHRIEAAEGQPTEATSHLEHEFYRLSLAFCPSAPLEPVDDILQQYT